MEDKYVRNSLRFFIGILLLVVLYSCANIAPPNRGLYDKALPRFVSSTPLPGQVNYKGKKVEIIFDELIQIDKPTGNMIITPPQVEQPVIRANGRKTVIELMDTLKENTTHTMDFTNPISDNNEKNVLKNYSFASSTGEFIDSMEVPGVLLNVENLEPTPGIMIGVHTNLEDSAFTTIPFVRTSRINDKEEFTIRNMAPGTYRIYALGDVMRSYRHSQSGQQIAFYDSLIVPAFKLTTRQDTIWKDSLMIDTVMTAGHTHFMPDNIELRLFKEKVERQYTLKPEHTGEKILTLRFNTSLDITPVPVPLNFAPADSSWYFLQTAEEGKAVHYWLTNSLIWKQDILQVEVNYLKSDSMNILRLQTDTVQFTMRRRPVEKKKKKKDDEPEPIEFLGMNVNTSGSINLYDTVAVAFSEPIAGLTKDHFYLDQKVDTLQEAVDFDFFPDTTNSLNFSIKRLWKYGEEYRLEVDSATIFSVYDKWNDVYSGEFKIKKEDGYGHLYINIEGANTAVFVGLLNSSDQPIRKAKVKDGGVSFMDLKPDKYYVRLVLDVDDNGAWDTGNYADKRQPEPVFYCPKIFNIMRNWQVEETWNIKVTPMKWQKPIDITKNKPKELTKKKRDYKNEGAQSPSNRNSDVSGLRF